MYKTTKKTLIEARKHGDFSFDEEWEGTRRRGRGCDRKRERERAAKRRKRGHVSITQLGPTGKEEDSSSLAAVRSTGVLVEFTR